MSEGVAASPGPRAVERGAIFEDLLNSLLTRGYWAPERTCSQSDFRQLADSLGPLLRATDIRIQDSNYRSQTSVKLDFHTDSVDARYVGWWCVCQSEPPLPTRLLDGRDLIRRLSQDDVDQLSRIRVPGVPTPGKPATTAAVLDYSAGRLVLNIHDNLEIRHPEHAALWLRLRTAVNTAQPSSMAIALKPGQCLFVDNHRFLHARDELPSGSNRWLKRLWLGATENLGPVVALGTL